MNFASNGKANAALTTGIIGTAGTGLGILANYLNSRINNPQAAAAAADTENQYVTRHELNLVQQLNSKDMEIASLRSNVYTDNAINGVQAQMGQQAVWNAAQQANIQCLQQQISQLQGMTKLGIPGSNIMPPYTTPPFVPFTVDTEALTRSSASGASTGTVSAARK